MIGRTVFLACGEGKTVEVCVWHAEVLSLAALVGSHCHLSLVLALLGNLERGEHEPKDPAVTCSEFEMLEERKTYRNHKHHQQSRCHDVSD